MENPQHPSREIIEASGGMSINGIARALKVAPATAHKLLSAGGGISPGMALRLEATFGNAAEYWMDLQRDYDLAVARAKK